MIEEKKTLSYYEGLVVELPVSFSWYNGICGFKDGVHESPQLKPDIDIDDKVLAIVASYNKIDKAIGYKKLIKLTGLTRYKLKIIIDKYRKSGLIYWHSLLDEDGLLSGKGLVFNEIY